MTDRQLVAVLVTDMVGYTSIMSADPELAVDLVNRSHDIIDSSVALQRGRKIEDVTDRTFSIFSSAIDAVKCAMHIQAELDEVPGLELRIGIDLGDVIISNGHIYGDAVNIASSIERIVDTYRIVVTDAVFKAIHGHIALESQDIGQKILRCVENPVHLYVLASGGAKLGRGNFLANIMKRRVPQIVGAYLASVWIIIEATDLLSSNGAFDRGWIYAVTTALLAFIPAVLMIAYVHGAHGRDSITRTEKTFVPLNVLLSILLALYALPGADGVSQSPRALPIDAASIAVLKFVNLSGDEGNSYFSSGLSEELINALAKVPSLYVASRSSSFIFQDPGVDPREVAQKLRVATVLEGSVRKQGNRVRITAQLIDGQNNYHLWTQSYDRELTDIFQIQEDIAISVATELLGILKPDLPVTLDSRKNNIEAYDLYLRGLDYLRKPATSISLADARDYFERSIALNAEYAQTHAALCEALLAQYQLESLHSHIDLAQESCETALTLDGELREVKMAMALLMRFSGEYEKSIAIYKEVLETQPNATTLVGLGQTLNAQGSFTEAELAFRNAVEREPGNWRNRMALGEFLYWQNRYEEALVALSGVIELSPGNARAYLLRGAAYGYLGDREAELINTLEAIEISPTSGAYRDLGLAYYYRGEFGKSVEAFQLATKLAPGSHWAWGDLALVLRMSGKEQDSKEAYMKARTLAQQSLQENPRNWLAVSRLAVYTVATGETDAGLRQLGTAVNEGAYIAEVHYYDATIHMYLDQREKALDALNIAIKKGYSKEAIRHDPQFSSLRDDDLFQRLLLNE